jgi:ubiquitin carboxyl-terminal hydrolase 34
VKTTESCTLPNPEALVKELCFFIKAAQNANSASFSEPDIQKLICHSISVLLDASVCQQGFWDVTKEHVNFGELVFSLLLEEKRPLIRRQVAEKIKTVCGPPTKTAHAESSNADESTESGDSTVAGIISTVWDAFLQNMQNTVRFTEQSEEYFSAALSVFRSVAERSPEDVVFTEYVSQWSESMLSHETTEVC